MVNPVISWKFSIVISMFLFEYWVYFYVILCMRLFYVFQGSVSVAIASKARPALQLKRGLNFFAENFQVVCLCEFLGTV